MCGWDDFKNEEKIMSTELTIALIELLLKVGPQVFVGIMKAMETDEPTVEDIKALRVKTPEEYLDE